MCFFVGTPDINFLDPAHCRPARAAFDNTAVWPVNFNLGVDVLTERISLVEPVECFFEPRRSHEVGRTAGGFGRFDARRDQRVRLLDTPAYTAQERGQLIGRNWGFEYQQIQDDIDYGFLLRPTSELTPWNLR